MTVYTAPAGILWQPTLPEESYMWKFMSHVNKNRDRHMKRYRDLYNYSISLQRDNFWEDILTYHPIIYEGNYSKVVDLDARIDSIPKWFDGLRLNWAENMLYSAAPGNHAIRTKHNKEDSKVAVLEVSESSAECRKFTYGELRNRVGLFSEAMRRQGVREGDHIGAVMGNHFDTLCVCLASASIGALFSTMGTDMGAKAILDRLVQIEPRLVFFDNSYEYKGRRYILMEKMKEVMIGLEKIRSFQGVVSICRHGSTCLHTMNVDRIQTLDTFLDGLQSQLNEPRFTRVPFAAGFIVVYSSGTTGPPKCLVHSVGGNILASWKDLHLHRNVGPNSRLQQFTITSWVMYLASITCLLQGASIVMYDGSPFHPRVDSFLRLAGREGVTHLGTSPRYLSMLCGSGIVPRQIPGLHTLQHVTSTGMVLSPQLSRWFYSSAGFPPHVLLANAYGGTDMASAFADGNPMEPLYDAGGCQCIALGCDIRIYQTPSISIGVNRLNGEELPIGKSGEVVCVKSFPSMPAYLLGDRETRLYHAAYFAHFDDVWAQGDYAYIEPQTLSLTLLGRADGVLNPSGVRFGSAEVYGLIETMLPGDIEDSICVGQRRANDLDEHVLLFVKMRIGRSFNRKIVENIRAVIAKGLSPRHVPRYIFEISDIPTTINFKKVEVPVKKILCGERIGIPSTLSNPTSLEYFYQFVDSEKMAAGLGQ